MFIGLNNKNERIYIDDAIQNKTSKYFCPICKQELIIKNGQINVAHFAHKSLDKCDTFTADMSQWHKDWQDVFPRKNQEVVLSLDIDEQTYNWSAYNYDFSDLSFDEYMKLRDEYMFNPNKERKILHIEHRADVLACGYVIEFQHSPISSKEFNERNWFYTECGYKVIWIFDLRDKYKNEQILYIDEWDSKRDNGAKYKWNNAIKTFTNFIPQNHKPHYIDDEWWDGDITLFFQLFDEDDDEDTTIMEKVTWAIQDFEKDENGVANFKRFITSYYPGNKKEFKDMIIKRKL